MTDLFQWLTQGVTIVGVIWAVYWATTWKNKVEQHIKKFESPENVDRKLDRLAGKIEQIANILKRE